MAANRRRRSLGRPVRAVVNPTAKRRMMAGEPVSMRQVASARALMAARYSLVDAAVVLGVRSSDLDLALWRYVGTDVEAILRPVDRPSPMF